MIKTGYFRIIGAVEQIVSYSEAYARGEEYLSKLRALQEVGSVSLYCACQEENSLPLFITKNHVIRVSHNRQQEEHLESCPKSEGYSRWVAENLKGVQSGEDERILFNITIPTGNRSSGSSGSDSSSEPNTDPYNRRSTILDMARIVNCLAFRKQTFSIKKQIGEARKAGDRPEWNYKDIEAFTRLWFGVSNDVQVYNKGEIASLYDMCYHVKDFYQSDFRTKYYMYAVIDKISEYKAERKYQYITVWMPSNKSSKKATVRVLTQDYDKMAEGIDWENCIKKVLCGYIQHDLYKATDGIRSDWMTLVKGAVMEVSDYGLYIRHSAEAGLLNMLCREHIVFYRPWQPIASYGSEMPTLVIERQKEKNLIVDIAKTSREYKKKEGYASGENQEYEVLLYQKDSLLQEMLCDIKRILHK